MTKTDEMVTAILGMQGLKLEEMIALTASRRIAVAFGEM
jgi:hypothetical protein